MIFHMLGNMINRRRPGSSSGSVSENIEVGPGNLKLTFSSTSGQLKRIYNSRTGVSIFLHVHTAHKVLRIEISNLTLNS